MFLLSLQLFLNLIHLCFSDTEKSEDEEPAEEEEDEEKENTADEVRQSFITADSIVTFQLL